MDRKELIYIYDWKQAYFYMCECGIIPIERPGVHPKTNAVYFVFNREETRSAYTKWLNRNK